MNKFTYLIVHLLQIVCLYFIYVFNDFYHNRLGFMRNTAYFQEKFASKYSSFLWLIPTLFLLLAIVFVIRKKTLESLVFLIESLLFSGWIFFFSLEQFEIYYLIAGIFALVLILQLVLVSLQKRKVA
ncbi:hypothetical protein [Enterococcus sp. AZ103]|uniref:hypothetical protein n=1 Tax=Enterococcus sp. AZ103 TaxID=2774628 RepID=UPI003F1F41EE